MAESFDAGRAGEAEPRSADAFRNELDALQVRGVLCDPCHGRLLAYYGLPVRTVAAERTVTEPAGLARAAQATRTPVALGVPAPSPAPALAPRAQRGRSPVLRWIE